MSCNNCSADYSAEPAEVRGLLAINYWGTMSITKRLLPHMRKGGRIVNMASMMGKLKKYSPEITSAFRAAASSRTLTPTDQIMTQYQESVDGFTTVTDGWPTSPYSVSKAGVVAATLALAKEQQRSQPERALRINTCCPGFVRTEMTENRGRKTVDEGAETPVHLALGDIGGVTGEFWENRKVSSW